MRHPFKRPVDAALPDVVLPEPRVEPFVLGLLRMAGGAYLRLALGTERVDIRGGDRLARLFDAALRGQARLILAFRHPYGDEAQLLSWAFTRGVEREARKAGVRLPRRPHAVFVHGYEVPRWGGPVVRWLLPRMGAMPVHHAKMDRLGMARIAAAIESGPYPVALAPEGQVSYSSETVPRLEQGTARLGFQAARALAAAGRPEPVLVLPLSVHRRYGPKAARSLERLITHIEEAAGTVGGTVGGGSMGAGQGARLAAARDAMLASAERFYGLPDGMAAGFGADARVAAVVDAALSEGERMLGLSRGSGDGIERVYRIRQAGWDRVYLPDGADPARLGPLDRSLADRRAGEAWYAMRHMELVDFAWYFRAEPPPDDAPFAARVEYAQNLWDFGSRLRGGTISDRIDVSPRRAVVVVGEPIDLSARLSAYEADRKAAAADATGALEAAYVRCMKEFHDER